MRFSRLPLIKIIVDHLIAYPTPISINYFWGLGSLAGIFLVIQLLTGIILSFHYVPEITLAFNSVEHIMRDVNYGWLFRYMHSNGASIFFFVMYVHIGRGIYFQSYEKKYLWYSGIILFLLVMATAFLGYVLPW
jgi:ubiquinol-cytochrome c reductase cytochrome b subunit